MLTEPRAALDALHRQKYGLGELGSGIKRKTYPNWMQRLEGDRLLPFLPEGMLVQQRQSLPLLYELHGAVHVVRRAVLMEQNRILGDHTRAIVMAREESIDIDDDINFQLAELIVARAQPT